VGLLTIRYMAVGAPYLFRQFREVEGDGDLPL